MIEETVNKKKFNVQMILYEQNIYMSMIKLASLIKEYNNFKMPITERIDNIIKHPKEFIEWIKLNNDGL